MKPYFTSDLKGLEPDEHGMVPVQGLHPRKVLMVSAKWRDAMLWLRLAPSLVPAVLALFTDMHWVFKVLVCCGNLSFAALIRSHYYYAFKRERVQDLWTAIDAALLPMMLVAAAGVLASALLPSDPRDRLPLNSALAVSAVCVALAALLYWLLRRRKRELQKEVAFFEPALLLADQQLQHFAQNVGGRYERGPLAWWEYTHSLGLSWLFKSRPQHVPSSLGGGSRVTCRFRGLEVQVGSRLERLTTGAVLVPNLQVSLPLGVPWTHVRAVQMLDVFVGLSAFDPPTGGPSFTSSARSPGVLWTWQLFGPALPKRGPFVPAVETALKGLAERACLVVAYDNLLDVSGWPIGGVYDAESEMGYGSFDVHVLHELIEHAVALVEAACPR